MSNNNTPLEEWAEYAASVIFGVVKDSETLTKDAIVGAINTVGSRMPIETMFVAFTKYNKVCDKTKQEV